MRPRTLWFAAVLILAHSLPAPSIDPSLYSGMRWRLIGPFRGGRSLTAVGVPAQPDVFYFGSAGGGVWKTNDAGRTWKPIFDTEAVASIGALAVAPSNPNVIYVGSGEADMRSDISYGKGLYKSTDGGKTWIRSGLEDTRQIGCILVDPHDPDVVLVAALGHAYASNPERGVFRSRDGGKTWQKILFKNADTGAIDLAFDPRDSRVIYAALWQTRRPPWNTYPPSNGPGAGLYKSTDGGDHWTELRGHGLPSEGLGRIGIAVAPSRPDRVYAIVDAKQGGLYRSDDAGQNWALLSNDHRVWQRGWYFGGVAADPKDPDTVYVANTALYRSCDGGKNFDALKGAPGGDDYHSLWVDPNDPARMIVASDQGVVISLNGGETWSSWYNQPTGQFYHVVADRRFPYWVYGSQQDSGSAATLSRSPHRGISARDWHPLSVGGESQSIAPDPLDPNILFGGLFGSAVGRYNQVTSQLQDVTPTLAHPGAYRQTWTLPLVFSPANPHALYYGTQVLFRTLDGGQSWQIVSPDLTREDPGVPPNLDAATAADAGPGARRGVIYTIAPSPLRADLLWIGTDDGYIQLTRDGGKTWQNVTPPELTPWSKITTIEASHFDTGTAYAAVDRHRLDDLKPYLYRTRDSGKVWRRIDRGIPEGSYVNVVREDPARRGLLYAGTETGAYVSFDDGDSWQPLQLNLPTVSIRDLAVAGDDLVAATHGRAFWILDDLEPLRQLNGRVAAADAWLFRPPAAWRVRPGSDEGTPLPPEVPQGENPPDGALIDYEVNRAPGGPLVIEIFDHDGKTVRRYSSADQPRTINPRTLEFPPFWVNVPRPPSAAPGMHRFVWDLRYEGPPGSNLPAFIAFGEGGLWAPPGDYTVRLTVGGHTLEQPLVVKEDPRVKASPEDLVKQFEAGRTLEEERSQSLQAAADAQHLLDRLRELKGNAQVRGELADVVQQLATKAEALAGQPAGGFGFSGGGPPTFNSSAGICTRVLRAIESADAAPTPDELLASRQIRQTLDELLGRWRNLQSEDVPRLNTLLRGAGLPALAQQPRSP